MTNYRRLISYIYAYEGNTKGKNIGFAKLESRNGQCKLSVNVKKVYVGSSDLEVYLLAPGKEISLGSIFIRGGSGEFRAVISVENAADSGCGLEQCYGLTIHEKNDVWRAYTTIWEDAVAHAAEVELAEITSGNLGNPEEQIHKKVEELAEEINDKVLSSSPGTDLSAALPQEENLESTEMNQPHTPEESAVREDGQITSATENDVQIAETIDENSVQITVAMSLGAMQAADAVPGPVTMGPQTKIGIVRNSLQTATAMTENSVQAENIQAENIQPENIQTENIQTVVRDLPAGEIPLDNSRQQTILHTAEALRADADPYMDGITLKEPGRTQSSEGRRPHPVVMPDTAIWQQRERTYRMNRHSRMNMPVGPDPAVSASIPVNASQPQTGEGFSRFNPRHQKGPFQRPVTNPGTSTQLQPEEVTAKPAQTQETLPSAQTPVENDGEKILSIDSRKEEILLGNPRELELLEQEEQENTGPRELWEGFRKRYPKIQAFDSASGCEILTVKPQDIGLLPRENWNYGNNSFLLHGYYNYRYLILARIGDESQGRTRYILGVPGHYYSNEKYMASMFGFPHFVLSKKQPSQDGRFGYWYTDVRMQNQD